VEVVPARVRPVPVKPAASPAVRPKGTQGRSYAFQLFDPRKPFLKIAKRKVLRVPPRIYFWGDYDPRISAQFPPPRPLAPPPAPVPDGLMDAARIMRRLQALESALDDLPRQALRLARLQQKRAASPGPTFKTPMRPGHPPGFRHRKRHEVHEILVECHYLALDSLKLNTSWGTLTPSTMRKRKHRLHNRRTLASMRRLSNLRHTNPKQVVYMYQADGF
jgi:hypothetical protein